MSLFDRVSKISVTDSERKALRRIFAGGAEGAPIDKRLFSSLKRKGLVWSVTTYDRTAWNKTIASLPVALIEPAKRAAVEQLLGSK